MSHVFHIKTGDTAPSVEATLKIGNTIVDLTDAVSVRFKMGAIDAAAVIVSPPTSGKVRYDWGAGETDVAGTHNAEFEITWTGGGVQTVPSKGYIKVVISEDLD